MNDTTLRMIIILEHLASTDDRVTTCELAKLLEQHGFNACERTIQRHINLLSYLYIIDKIPRNFGSGWILRSRLDQRYINTLRCVIHGGIDNGNPLNNRSMPNLY